MAVISKKSIAIGAGAGTIIAIIVLVLVLVFALSFTEQEPTGNSILDPTLARSVTEEVPR